MAWIPCCAQQGFAEPPATEAELLEFIPVAFGWYYESQEATKQKELVETVQAKFATAQSIIFTLDSDLDVCKASLAFANTTIQGINEDMIDLVGSVNDQVSIQVGFKKTLRSILWVGSVIGTAVITYIVVINTTPIK